MECLRIDCSQAAAAAAAAAVVVEEAFDCPRRDGSRAAERIVAAAAVEHQPYDLEKVVDLTEQIHLNGSPYSAEMHIVRVLTT